MKKTVLLNGSPRKNGFTAQMIEQLKQVLGAQLTVVDLYKSSIRPCIDCRVCEKQACPFNTHDDLQSILQTLYDADRIIVATPIYFAGLPAPLKAFVDRSQQFFLNRADNRTRCFPNRREGYLLMVSGQDDDLVTQSCRVSVEMFFRCMNADMIDWHLLGNTDARTDCPEIDRDFLAHFA